jgi:DNA-binding transcriptional MocR family regulator
VTTCGAIESIGLALGAVAMPGATVGVEAPTYAGIFQLVRGLGYKVLEIPLDAVRGLTPEALEAALRKSRGSLQAVVTIPNFSNPLGTRVSDSDKAALTALASREGIVLIEDDIYGDLGFERERPKPLKAFDRDDSVILCTSFSKTISPALRIGAAISAKHAARIAALKYARGTGTSAFGEEVLQRFLDSGIYERHLGKVRGEYRTLIARYAQQILQSFPAGTRVSQPQGGYILWVELPHAIDGRQIQKHALTKRISVAPGSIFSENGGHYRNYIRLNCAIPWTEASRKALLQLARLVAQQK